MLIVAKKCLHMSTFQTLLFAAHDAPAYSKLLYGCFALNLIVMLIKI